MTTAELKEYLGMVVQVEKEVEMQEQLCQKMRQKEKQYEQSIQCFTNRLSDKVIDVRNAPERRRENEKKAKLNMTISSLVPIILIATVVSFVLFFFTGLELVAITCNILLILSIVAVIKSIMEYLEYSAAKEKDKTIYDDAMKQYQHKLDEKEEIQKENDRCRKEIEKLKTLKQVAEAYCQKVENSLATSKRNLEKMYSYNIVFPKYRNYVMVSSIYEYLCAGRCKTLEGHEGAYNILELEIRLDRIITQLDRVIENLEAIRANQYMLYSCLKESNRKMDMLLQEENRIADSMQNLGTQSYEMNRRLGELQHSSELASYLAECNNRQLSYMNRMNYLAGHYDNPYGNYAPV